MSQSRWKYWIGDDGMAPIRRADMPPQFLPNAQLAEKPKIGISIGIKMNPDYYEFKAEILRVTGKAEVIVVSDENKNDKLKSEGEK